MFNDFWDAALESDLDSASNSEFWFPLKFFKYSLTVIFCEIFFK